MGFKNTRKKVRIPVIVASFILMGFLVVQAQTDKPLQPGSNIKGSIFVGKEYKGENQKHAALASRAKISMEQAIGAAKVAYPGYRAVGAIIENENGYLVYAVQMVNDTGRALDVKVDAGDAKVLAAESDFKDHENGEENNENEGEEDNDREDNDNRNT
jgi:hypothetical protein